MKKYTLEEIKAMCLNPCFSGNRFGRTEEINAVDHATVGLNPCFSGNRFGRPHLLGKENSPKRRS